MHDLAAMTHAELVAEVLRLRAQEPALALPSPALSMGDPFDPERLGLFDQVLDAVIVTDRDFTVRYSNAAAEVLYGWPSDELRGRSALTVLQVALYRSGETGASAAETLRLTGRWRGEVVQTHRDGRPLEVEASVQAYNDAAGVLQGFVAINRDIGERHRFEAEQARLRAQANVAETMRDEALALLDALIAGSPSGVAFLDPQLRFLRINQALADFNGRPIDAHLGRSIAELFPKMAEKLEPTLRRVLSEGVAVCDIEISGGVGAGTGPRIDCLASFYPVLLAPGRIVGVGVVVTDVTRLKRAEAELRSSEQRFRLALDHFPSTFVIYDAERRLQYVNPRGLAVAGLELEAMLGRRDEELFPPSIVDGYLPLLDQALAGGEPQRSLLSFAMPSGQYYSEVTYVPIVDEAGQVIQLFGITYDMTERVRAAETLRQMNERLEASERAAAEQAALLDTLIANAPIGMAFFDRELRFRQVNPVLAAMNERSSAEHFGRLPHELLPKAGHLLESLLKQVLATGDPLLDIELVESELVASGLSRIWLASYYPVRDAEGSLLGVGAIVSEVSAQRYAAQARERQRRELEAIIETLEEGVLAFYQDGTIAALNSAGKRLRELPLEASPATWEELMALSPFSTRDSGGGPLPREQWPLTRVLAGERFIGIELSLQRADSGEQRWLTYNGAALYDEQGAFALGVVTARDITQRKRDEVEQRAYAETLSRTNAELARALRLKDEFLTMMSHELRTPLNVVLGIIDALDEQLYGPITERQRRALATASQSGRHLLALLSDILDLARIESGAEVLDLGPISIAALCRTALQYVHAAAQQKQLHLELTIINEAQTLRADERRLTQIVVNLLDNAVKFTPSGGKVGLEVSNDVAQELVCFTVWDSGIGIAPADMDRLFQPFTQVDGRLSREYGGIGLGLTLVRRLVELHGGSVSVESAPGRGSRFVVCLPTAPANASPPVAPPMTIKDGLGAGLRVVLADDHEPTLSLYSELLERQGSQVATARTGIEALALVHSFQPDVVVLDIQMPGMDGLEAIRRLRSDPATASVPVIALTALAMPGDRERCLEAGANVYLAKPVRLRKLLEAMDEVVNA